VVASGRFVNVDGKSVLRVNILPGTSFDRVEVSALPPSTPDGQPLDDGADAGGFFVQGMTYRPAAGGTQQAETPPDGEAEDLAALFLLPETPVDGTRPDLLALFGIGPMPEMTTLDSLLNRKAALLAAQGAADDGAEDLVFNPSTGRFERLAPASSAASELAVEWLAEEGETATDGQSDIDWRGLEFA
jgi:hypothetical protein